LAFPFNEKRLKEPIVKKGRTAKHVRMEPYCGAAILRSFIVQSHVLWLFAGAWHQTDLANGSSSKGSFLLLTGNA
jgi:hypothetical protein